MKDVSYYPNIDTLCFTSEKLGECEIDENGDMEIDKECLCCCEGNILRIHIDEMREIIKLYDERKEDKK